MFVRKYRDKYRFGERYKDPLTDKWRTVTIMADRNTRNTRHEAQILLDKKIQDKLSQITGERNTRHDMTLGELYSAYWEEKRPTWRENSAKAFKNSLEKFIGAFGNDAKISKITPLMLTNYFDNLNIKIMKMQKDKKTHHRGIRTISGAKIYYSRASMMFNFAVRKRYLKRSPFKDTEIEWAKEDHHSEIEKKYLDDNELKILLNYFQEVNPVVGDTFEWQYLTGMRYGEATAVQVKNVNLKDKTVLVCGTIIGSGKVADLTKQMSTKTESGYRTIHLSERAIEIYKKHSKGKKKSDFLFTNPHTGNLYSAVQANALLKVFRKHHDFDKIITTHTFRHTHVSKLAELGVPLYLIQHNVGHSKSKITQQVYLHVTKKAEQELNDKLNLM